MTTTTIEQQAPTTTNGRAIGSVAAMNGYVKEIANVLRRSGRAGALQYVPEITWLLFLRILDEREQDKAREAAALGLPFRPTIEAPYRWCDWAAPYDPKTRDAQGRAQGWKRKELNESQMGALKAFVNDELIPTIRKLEESAQHGSPQHVLSQIFYNTPRTYIDTEYNLLEVLDRVHRLSSKSIDNTHIFPLSQVYEGLLLSMGQKNNDGGQFFTPREVIRVMVRVLDPRPSQSIYDPCCGTGGFLAETFSYIVERYGPTLSAEQFDRLETQTFYGREKDALVYPIALANLVLHGIDLPHIWLGNTLTGDPAYAKLFEDAPTQFDIVLTNPPFGGKESKTAQKKFTYETGATQVLFLQHILEELKDGGVCGVVLDEGVLFRTTEGGFVGTKKRLCEDAEVFCIVSLPGGVFTNAGAGVKTNLVFFRKGSPTTAIWYYDLSDLKINKGNPLTVGHFDDFLQRYRLAPAHPGRISPKSWTVDFEARKESARAAAAPIQTKAKELWAQATAKNKAIAGLKAQIRQVATLEARDELLAQIGRQEDEQKQARKQAQALENEATGILNAVYDLKAVNPNSSGTRDQRTPDELLSAIEEAQQAISLAVEALRASRSIVRIGDGD